MNGTHELLNLIKEDLAKGQIKNPSYSLRAFSKKLRVSPSTLSEILSGKRALTAKMADRFLTRLEVEPKKAREILESFQLKPTPKAILPLSKLEEEKRRKAYLQNSDRYYAQLSTDEFHLIADWEYYAVLTLAETDGFRENAKGISQRLGITQKKATEALTRLERLNLVQKEKDETYRRSGSKITTTQDVPSISLRKSHHQNLDLAKKSLDEDPVEERDFTSMTIATTPQKMKEAKERIKKFRRELAEFLEDGEKSEVYQLNLQFFSLTKHFKNQGIQNENE